MRTLGLVNKKNEDLKRRLDALLLIALKHDWDFPDDKQICLEHILFAAYSWGLKRDAYNIADLLLKEVMQYRAEYTYFTDRTLLVIKKLGKKQKLNRIMRNANRKLCKTKLIDGHKTTINEGAVKNLV